MRSLRDFILETIKPVAPGERKMWDKHSVAVKKHDEPERDEARFRGTNVKEAPFKGKGEDGWLKTGVDKTQRDERDEVERLGEDVKFYTFGELLEAGVTAVTDEHGHTWHHRQLYRKPSHPEYHGDFAHLPVHGWHNTHTNHVSDASSLRGGVYFSGDHASALGIKHDHTYHMDHYSEHPVVPPPRKSRARF